MARDTFGRRVDYLRVSITDRCNLRCLYCMPRAGVVWKDRSELLTFEELERFVAVAASEGISRIRLTGGEPLARKDIVDLARRLRSVPGIESLALTTNGTLLPLLARALVASGIERVNISLVSLDPATYSRATRGGRLEDALAGVDAALAAGMSPVKINVVIMRSLHQDPLEFARLTLERPLHVRFIEYMPIGSDWCGDADDYAGETAGDWTRSDRVPSDEILGELETSGARAGLGPLEPVEREEVPAGWGPARYFRFKGAQGTVGVISPLSHMFCADCNRLRLTADGQVRPCLFSDDELDARRVLRHGTESELRALVVAGVAAKPESHNMQIGTLRRMSQVGG
jgi:cyclic pyranopterin phosphate synthase